MSLDKPSIENLTHILEELAQLLDVANRELLDPKHYDLQKYDELKFMYDMISKKGGLSTSEIHAFMDELRSIRMDQ